MTEHDPPALLLRVEDVARMLNLSRSKVYELIGTGKLKVVHVDRSVRVPVDAVAEFVDGLRAAGE